MNPKIALVLLAGLLMAPQPQVGNGTRDWKALKRDLEVMRRILDREVRSQASRDVINMFSLARTEAPSEAFYVPGEGALFLMRLSSWIEPKPRPATDEAEVPEATLWNEVRAEVEGRPAPQIVRVDVRHGPSLSAAQIESKVLGALARYAANIGQLPDEEHLTVIVRGGGRAETNRDEFGHVVGQGGEPATMVIQVRRGDAAGGKLTAEELRKRAKVTVY